MLYRTMLLTLDHEDTGPLYLQIAAAVRRALVEGDVSAGDRLPAGRALAESLGVNMHTVLRAYAELEREGLVRMRRGRGVVVTEMALDRARLHELVRQVSGEARRLGVTKQELMAMFEELS